MTSTSSSNHQHPTSTSHGDFSGTLSTSISTTDQNTHLATSGYAPSENQLAGLVEAATAAAGQEDSEWAAAAAVAAATGAAGTQHHLDGYAPDLHIDDDGFGDAGYGSGLGSGRQYRATSSTNEQSQPTGLTRAGTKKRKRNEDALDPALTAASALGGGHQQAQQTQQHQPQHNHNHSDFYGGGSLEIRNTPPQSLSESRSIGMHSAVALFRQPSSNKKYTRPPMSKLFSSLELSPENFLHLQAAAKSYMLDDRHPERRDCVGQRGRGDTEMVKLRLWNCVRHFLEVEGHGPRFFGEHVVNEGMGPRTYIWPRDQQKIISLVIPLLRRMVTNERQRQYAVETRKGGGTEERRRRKTEDSIQNLNASPKFTADEHLQIQTQHHADEYGSIQTPLSALQPQLQSPDINLAGLFLEGYPTDWDIISKSYDFYNNNNELDNLWSLSGLQLGDWRGLVAAVDSHYQIIHNGSYDCRPFCEDQNVDRILESEETADLRWRLGGNQSRPGRNEFASSITHDISRIIRENLAMKQGASITPYEQTPISQHPPLPSLNCLSSSENANIITNSSSTLTLRINILQGGKRILPRFDICASQCPDIATIKQLVSRRFAGQLPGIPTDANLDAATGPWSSLDHWKFKIWLPDGLTLVQNDGEWTIALLSAEKVDWMDGDLRVLVELDGVTS